MRRPVLIFAVLLMFVFVGCRADGKKFILQGNNTATASVKSEELILNVSLGPVSDYPACDYPCNPPNHFDFNLTIGGRELAISAYTPNKTHDSVQFFIQDSVHGDYQDNLTSIVVNKTHVVFVGTSPEAYFPVNATFEKEGDSYKIPVKLEGHLPPNLVLTSDALIYEPKNGLSTGAIIGITLGSIAVVALLVAGSIVGFILWRKKKQNAVEGGQIKDGDPKSKVQNNTAVFNDPTQASKKPTENSQFQATAPEAGNAQQPSVVANNP